MGDNNIDKDIEDLVTKHVHSINKLRNLKTKINKLKPKGAEEQEDEKNNK